MYAEIKEKPVFFLLQITGSMHVTRTLKMQWGLYCKFIITMVSTYSENISLNCCHWRCYICCALVTIQSYGNKHM